MSVVLHILTWLLGIFLSVQLVASCYSVVDFRGQLARYRRVVIGRIAMSLFGLAIIYWLLPESYETTLIDGVQFHVAIHVLMILLPNLILVLGRFVAEKKYRQFLLDPGPRNNR